jgi:hypothetical protein
VFWEKLTTQKGGNDVKLSFYLLCFCTSDGVVCSVVNYQLSCLAALRTELADGFG